MIKKGLSMIILVLLIASVASIVEGGGLEETYKEAEFETADLSDSAWPKKRGNRKNTGFIEVDTSYVDGTEKWRFSIGDQSMTSPVIGEDDTIYFGTRDPYTEAGNLYAVNPDSTEKWRFTSSASIESSPAVGENGTIYFGSTDGFLYAVNPDGSLNWRSNMGPFSESVSSSPNIGEDGTIYVGTVYNDLYAVHTEHTDGEPGTEKWSFETDGSIKTSPAIGEDGTLYVSTNGGSLYAIYPNGTEKWSFSADDMIQTSPAIGEDGTIYFGTGFGLGPDDTNVYAINPDGTERWSFETDDTITSSPAIGDDGTLYIGSHDSHLYALHTEHTDGEPGTEKWRFEVTGEIRSSPVIGGDGTVYFGTFNFDFLALHTEHTDGEPGTEKWRFEDGYSTSTSPAIAEDGTIYYTSTNGDLFALGGVPSAPQDLEATPGTGQVELNWEPPLEKGGGGFIGYNIYRGTDSEDLERVAEVGEDTTSYLDEDVIGDRTYYYRVSAVSGDGEGEESNDVEATPSVDWTRFDHIGIEPGEETTTAGESVEFIAFGYDTNGDEMAVLTEDTEWSIEEGAAGEWVGWEYTSENAGEWSVYAEFVQDGEVYTDEVSLTVEPASVSYIVIEPQEDVTIIEGKTISFSAEAYDEYDNLVEDDDEEFTWKNADGDGYFQKYDAGEYEVAASLDGESSESVQVNVEEPGFISNYWWLFVVLAVLTLLIGMVLLVVKRRNSRSLSQRRFEQQDNLETHIEEEYYDDESTEDLE